MKTGISKWLLRNWNHEWTGGKEKGKEWMWSEYVWKCNRRKREKSLRAGKIKGGEKDPCIRERWKSCEGNHAKEK